jgi:hypothetical protein
MSVGTDSTNHFLSPPMRTITIRRRPLNYLNIRSSKISASRANPVVGLAAGSTSEEHQYHQYRPDRQPNPQN